MKKLSLLLSVLMVVMLFSGCDLFERKRQHKAPIPNDINSQIIDLPNGENVSAINADKAKQIAFERAGIKAEDAKFLEVEYDYDDDLRIFEYSVEFEAGGYEYDFEINAENGQIIKYEKDKDLF